MTTAQTATETESLEIIDLACSVLSKGKKEPVAINKKGQQVLQGALSDLHGEQLDDAVMELIGFSYVLEEVKQSPAAAEIVLNLAEAVLAVEEYSQENVSDSIEDGSHNKFGAKANLVALQVEGQAKQAAAPEVMLGMAARMRG